MVIGEDVLSHTLRVEVTGSPGVTLGNTQPTRLNGWFRTGTKGPSATPRTTPKVLRGIELGSEC